jgi:hypothetical protein
MTTAKPLARYGAMGRASQAALLRRVTPSRGTRPTFYTFGRPNRCGVLGGTGNPTPERIGGARFVGQRVAGRAADPERDPIAGEGRGVNFDDRTARKESLTVHSFPNG